MCDVVFPDDEDGLMLYWKAFFDRSGKDTHMLVAAGYLSNRQKWKRFNKAWKELLTTDGRLDIFHATDFEAGQKAFTEEKGWPKERREKVRAELIGALIDADLEVGAACGIVVEDYERVMKGWRRSEFGSPYKFAVTSCMRAVAFWCQTHRIKEPIAYIVEAGDEDEGMIASAHNSFFANPALRQFFRLGSLTFVPKQQQVPLQSADMLGHYMWKWARQEPLPDAVARLIYDRGDRLMWSYFDGERLEEQIAKDDSGRSTSFPDGTITMKTPPSVDLEIDVDFDETVRPLEELRALMEKYPHLVYPLIKDSASVSKLFTIDAKDESTTGTNSLRVSFKPTEFALSNVAALRALERNSELSE
jgi:hypothetical protein